MSEAARSSIVLLNHRSELRRLSHFVEHFSAAHGLSEDDAANINLVLDEIVTNVMRHGYEDRGEHEIHVTLGFDRGVAEIEVRDDGKAFDPFTQAPPPKLDVPIEERPIGGLGVYIVRELVDTTAYRREDGRNVVTMTKKIG